MCHKTLDIHRAHNKVLPIDWFNEVTNPNIDGAQGVFSEPIVLMSDFSQGGCGRPRFVMEYMIPIDADEVEPIQGGNSTKSDVDELGLLGFFTVDHRTAKSSSLGFMDGYRASRSN